MDEFVTQDQTLIEAEPINYSLFIKAFNGISANYKAVKDEEKYGGVTIVDEADEDVAYLYGRSDRWAFGDSTFSWGELKLMSDLASTMPIYRDKPDDDMAALRQAFAEARWSEMKGDE